MNKFFNSASERFDKLKGRDFLINPISRTDCEIVIELGQILKKAGLEEVTQILSSYKEFKDEEIRDRLLQWNIDNPNLKKPKSVSIKKGEEDPIDDLPKPVYFRIKDLMIFQYDFHGLKVFERFDEENENYVYGIILNPIPDGLNLKSVPAYANERVEFSSEEDRNILLERLENFLKERGFDTINFEGNE